MSAITRERLLIMQKWRETYGPGCSVVLPAEEAEELARIALASLEAEAVHQVFDESGGWFDIEKGDVVLEGDDGNQIRTLYTAPPAPVAMKDHQIRDLVNELRDIAVEYYGTQQLRERIAKTVRAAILQGSDGNSPVISDGWVACSERMPDIDTEIFYFCKDDGLRDCGIVSSSNFSGRGDAQLYVHAEGYDLRLGVDITHWMPLPAAPQQEVKP